MANTFFKSLGESDRTSSKTLLHESIPITGTLVSGTYAESAGSDTVARGNNIKTFSHGMFQSVYDYPYTSSSANHIFDITAGVAPYVPETGGSFQGLYTSADQLYNIVVTGSGLSLAKKKRAIYNQMAQVLVGYDTKGDIRLFDLDGDFSTGATNASGSAILDPIFLNFSRLLTKDEIKKGSFSLTYGAAVSYDAPFTGKQLLISDLSGSTSYKVNSPAGEYGILYATDAVGTTLDAAATAVSGSNVGLIYYQAGIVVLDASRIHRARGQPDGDAPADGESFDLDGLLVTSVITRKAGSAVSTFMDTVFASSSIDTIADNVRHRISNISFNNTTELNSTIYFCRANHNEFNYSANPTYLTGSQIRVKAGDSLIPPRSYVTTVGMYSADNELLAVAKLSEPLRKDPTNELTLRVRLDY